MLSKCISTGTIALAITLVGLCMLTSGSVVPPPVRGSTEAPLVGLYELNGKVAILTVDNFNDTVLHQNRSLLVEFYNTFCGHCQRYAPHYKALAERLYPWRETLLVAAIDCNAFENTGICRDYEIFAYPTLRYFSPGYVCKEGNYGQPVNPHDELPELASNMAQRLAAENGTDSLPNFPNLHSVTEKEENKLFNGLDSNKKYVILAYEPENTTLGIESVLHFHLWPDVQIRRVTDINIANHFQIDGVHYKLATVDRKGNVVPYSVKEDTAEAYAATIQSILEAQHFKPRSSETQTKKGVMETGRAHNDDDAIISEVLRNKHLVYQADLEMALRQMLFNEIPKVHEIHGEQLLALQRMLRVLQNYHPLGPQGNEVIRRINEYVLNSNETIFGSNIQNELEQLNKTFGPIFSSNHFIGCIASQHNKRGYTCSLWTLFHYLTVQAERLQVNHDPLEVLTAIHGYVKFFFGCTHCSEHFQDMAMRRKIWQVPSKAEAVLWLWEAHNEVNNRLAGDATEDPKFPKIQFPSKSSCPLCHQTDTTSSSSKSPNNINWDREAVFSFLKNIHNPGYVSRYGVDNESVLNPSLEKLRQKRMISNVFSEMDMRMGMFLYLFCIVMMVVAFKLFALKGYRKKPYMHDMLGKV